MQTTHGSSTALALHNLAFFPDAQPLTFSLPSGSCTAMLGIGPDNVDLTYLAETLAGRRPYTAGQIEINGTPCDLRPSSRKKLATIGPHTPLLPHISVWDNILLPLRANGTLHKAEITHRGSEILALTGLEALRMQPASTLDAAQAFRTKLARGLITHPDVLVLNQPFENMDQPTIRHTLTFLDRLRHAVGLSILLLSRQKQNCMLAADQIGIMENGTLLQVGDVATLLNRPACLSVAAQFGEANVLSAKVLLIEDDIATLRLPTGETVEAMADENLEENDLASICIPPDRLSVLFPRSGSMETEEKTDLACTLVSAHHIGHAIAMRFRTLDGTEIIAHRPLVHLPRELRPGNKAILAWQPQNAIAFPMDAK
ncbi:spermidine/putrescine ABC transporter ATP-binding protein [Acetobacter pomorum]|uniref:Spermidine/putrescine ABC transporter ATP-binding protein n=1 Tax=Acetobacter pomorum TaxID=65959 RepID=A0A2G4RDJ5_9PROT|nr:ATP-binding cassette domain-containing protein [Acetobacter pomorum]PHY93805.1 spermidine/putrescine ABC transporter ATP-binding protein [Acetobacter pomorum]GBR54810.1 spermidine/putrescine transporter ATP-binding protein [Acetobacter pomorum DSM 11825]